MSEEIQRLISALSAIKPSEGGNTSAQAQEEAALFIREGREAREEDRKRAASDRRMREWFAPWAFGVFAFWVVFLAASVLLSGFKLWGFTLSDTLLIALLGSTTGAIGLATVVVKNLFPTLGKK